MISDCNCKSEFQDKTYGKNKRIFNKMKNNKYRCTVCSKEKNIGEVISGNIAKKEEGVSKK